MAGKQIAPISLCSDFSPCFSEQVGAMVIGAIEIDGTPRAVPMEMLPVLGELGFRLLHTTGPPRDQPPGQGEGATVGRPLEASNSLPVVVRGPCWHPLPPGAPMGAAL